MAPPEIFFAEHVQITERQRALADPGQERGELPGLGPAGVLHALLVRGEFHHDQVPVPGVPVSSEHRRWGIRSPPDLAIHSPGRH
jgi:hypothetical protein